MTDHVPLTDEDTELDRRRAGYPAEPLARTWGTDDHVPLTDETCVTNNFTMDCPNCGPETIHFLDGEMVPHGCDYVPPSLVIDCGEMNEEATE